MKGRRWTEQEDELLKESVLRSISTGGTQLDAFAEVGKKLGRTAGACGFRWNAVLRQKYLNMYVDAKKQRVFNQLEKRKRPQLDSFAGVVQILKQCEQNWCYLQESVVQLTKELQRKKEKIHSLLEENKRIKAEQNSYQQFQQQVKERYKQLMYLLKRLEQEEVSSEKTHEIQSREYELADDTSSDSSA
ncbi:hypothetical protein [Thermoflavimicrobium dichotomicum]|uniref:Transcription factor, RsfA family n=1 Tax=Thermoflavimicrobium dichotomicum TaxID=46223 RepID=A0A1I3MIV7_9BACL|nr:hypothetical protein [Thermoflavimicrobium dichotomicum]SFI96872.1 transcription factor, RsfA family [Thermoflavimicrobium dichotomicum]